MEKIMQYIAQNLDIDNDLYSFDQHVSLIKNIKLAQSFFHQIDLEYEKRFKNFNNIVYSVDDKPSEYYHAIDRDNINIYYEGSLKTAQAIVHEFTHYLINKKEEKSSAYKKYCEVPTILSEFLFEDYLDKLMYDTYELRCLRNKSNTKIINNINDNKYYKNKQKYLLSTLIAGHLYVNTNAKETYKNLINNLNNMTEEEFFEEYGIDFNDISFLDECIDIYNFMFKKQKEKSL